MDKELETVHIRIGSEEFKVKYWVSDGLNEYVKCEPRGGPLGDFEVYHKRGEHPQKSIRRAYNDSSSVDDDATVRIVKSETES